MLGMPLMARMMSREHQATSTARGERERGMGRESIRVVTLQLAAQCQAMPNLPLGP